MPGSSEEGCPRRELAARWLATLSAPIALLVVILRALLVQAFALGSGSPFGNHSLPRAVLDAAALALTQPLAVLNVWAILVLRRTQGRSKRRLLVACWLFVLAWVAWLMSQYF